jgi:HYR domain
LVLDNDLGVGSVNAITTIAMTAAGASVSFMPPTSSDDGGETAMVSCDHNSGDTFAVGTTTVTCMASDADDTPSQVQASFHVTVTDSDLALHGAPANITTDATSPAGAPVVYMRPTATDEGGQTRAVSCDHASGSMFPIGATAVTCSASASDGDDSNSPVTGTFTVTVVAPSAPIVRGASESAKTWRENNQLARITARKNTKPPVGTTFSFSLNEQARATLNFTQRLAGRKVLGNCLAQSTKNRDKPRCARTVIVGTLTFIAHHGVNKVRFAGRVSTTKKLKLGRYTLQITATNAQGRSSAQQSLSFTIVKYAQRRSSTSS